MLLTGDDAVPDRKAAVPMRTDMTSRRARMISDDVNSILSIREATAAPATKSNRIRFALGSALVLFVMLAVGLLIFTQMNIGTEYDLQKLRYPRASLEGQGPVSAQEVVAPVPSVSPPVVDDVASVSNAAGKGTANRDGANIPSPVAAETEPMARPAIEALEIRKPATEILTPAVISPPSGPEPAITPTRSVAANMPAPAPYRQAQPSISQRSTDVEVSSATDVDAERRRAERVRRIDAMRQLRHQ